MSGDAAHPPTPSGRRRAWGALCSRVGSAGGRGRAQGRKAYRPVKPSRPVLYRSHRCLTAPGDVRIATKCECEISPY